MQDETKRQAFLQTARQHYYQHDQAQLLKMLGSKGQGIYGQGLYAAAVPMNMVGRSYGSGFKPSDLVQRKYMEVDGMPDPTIYNYFSDFDSPLKQTPPPVAKAYPLYNQFGTGL